MNLYPFRNKFTKESTLFVCSSFCLQPHTIQSNIAFQNNLGQFFFYTFYSVLLLIFNTVRYICQSFYSFGVLPRPGAFKSLYVAYNSVFVCSVPVQIHLCFSVLITGPRDQVLRYMWEAYRTIFSLSVFLLHDQQSLGF